MIETVSNFFAFMTKYIFQQKNTNSMEKKDRLCGYKSISNYECEIKYKHSNYVYVCKCSENGGIGLGYTPNDWWLHCQYGNHFNEYSDPWPKSYYNYIGKIKEDERKRLVEADFDEQIPELQDKIVMKFETTDNTIGVWNFGKYYLHFSKEKPLIIPKLRKVLNPKFSLLCDATVNKLPEHDNLHGGIVLYNTESRFSPNTNILFHLSDGSIVSYKTAA